MQVQIIGTGTPGSITVPSEKPNLCLVVAARVEGTSSAAVYISAMSRNGQSLTEIVEDYTINASISGLYLKARGYLFAVNNPLPGTYSLSLSNAGTPYYRWYLLDNVDTSASWTSHDQGSTSTSDSMAMTITRGSFRTGVLIAGATGYIGGEIADRSMLNVAFTGGITGYDRYDVIIPVTRSSTCGGYWSVPSNWNWSNIHYFGSHISAWIPPIATTKTPLFAMRGGGI